MKKGIGLFVKAGLFLVTPMLFASYGKRPIQFATEMRCQMINASWHTKASSTSAHLDAMTVSITNASGYSYQVAGDRLPNYNLGARFSARTKYANDLSVMVALGIEMGMADAKGYRPVSPDLGSRVITTTEWDDQAKTAVARWSDSVVLAPALFVGSEVLSVGIEYDAREYRVEGHQDTLVPFLNKRIRDHQVLYGLRGAQHYDLGHGKFIVSFEVMTNLNKEADKEMKEYFVNLAKYGTDLGFTEDSSTVMDASGLQGAGNGATIGTRAKVSTVNTKLTKASLGVGLMLKDF